MIGQERVECSIVEVYAHPFGVGSGILQNERFKIAVKVSYLSPGIMLTFS